MVNITHLASLAIGVFCTMYLAAVNKGETVRERERGTRPRKAVSQRTFQWVGLMNVRSLHQEFDAFTRPHTHAHHVLACDYVTKVYLS